MQLLQLSCTVVSSNITTSYCWQFAHDLVYSRGAILPILLLFNINNRGSIQELFVFLPSDSNLQESSHVNSALVLYIVVSVAPCSTDRQIDDGWIAVRYRHRQVKPRSVHTTTPLATGSMVSLYRCHVVNSPRNDDGGEGFISLFFECVSTPCYCCCRYDYVCVCCKHVGFMHVQ